VKRVAGSVLFVLTLPLVLSLRDPGMRSYFVANLFNHKDPRPPTIRLKDWADTQTVFLEKAYIEGEVSAESKVESVTVNQIPVLRRKGRHIFFSHMANLKEGENILTVAARDEFGQRATKRIIIIRRVPKALQLAERLSLTVFPFEHKGDVSAASLAFQDNLIDALVHRNRFRVVERNKLEVILEEQRLSRTALFDQDTALKVGKLLAARSVITGNIVKAGTGIHVVARLVDTQTSRILSRQNVYGEGEDFPALQFMAEGMAVQFHRDFPLVGGLIVEQRGQEILTNLGKDLIKPQRRLILYREEPIEHPVTGKVLGANNRIIGRALVTEVMPDMSKAELLDCKGEAVRRLDRVMAE